VHEEGDLSGWYENLAVPIARTWLWCQQQHSELRDTCRGRADEACAKSVNAQFRENRTNYKAVRKTINPRRVHDRKWVRFVLHINELKKIGEGMETGFGTSIQIMLGAKRAGAEFCDGFKDDLEFWNQYTVH
jgi:flagellar biosynthesis regulator FlaF